MDLIRSARLAVPHGFTGRGLDLRARAADWERAAGAVLPGAGAGAIACLEQVHGAAVVRVEAPAGALAPAGRADALVTTRPGTILAVRAADCLPVLLSAPGGVAAAHAGWRGLAAGVVPAALAALLLATGAAADEVTALLGPHATRLETGDDVARALGAAGVPEAAWRAGGRGEKHLVDLAGAAEAQLRAAGVVRVERTGGCTLTEPARFWSHRREGAAAGRQAGLIAL